MDLSNVQPLNEIYDLLVIRKKFSFSIVNNRAKAIIPDSNCYTQMAIEDSIIAPK